METYIIRINGEEYEVEVEKKNSAGQASAPARAEAPKAAKAAAKKAAAGTGAAEAMTQVVGTALGLAAVAGVSLIAVGVVLDTLFEDVADKERKND